MNLFKQLRQEGIRMKINELTIENKRLLFENEQLKKCVTHMTSEYLRHEQSGKLLELCIDEIETYRGRDTALTCIIRNHLNDTEVKNYENNKM